MHHPNVRLNSFNQSTTIIADCSHTGVKVWGRSPLAAVAAAQQPAYEGEGDAPDPAPPVLLVAEVNALAHVVLDEVDEVGVGGRRLAPDLRHPVAQRRRQLKIDGNSTESSWRVQVSFENAGTRKPVYVCRTSIHTQIFKNIDLFNNIGRASNEHANANEERPTNRCWICNSFQLFYNFQLWKQHTILDHWT